MTTATPTKPSTPSWFSRSHRRSALGASAALAIVVTMTGAAQADNSSTTASTVQGALVEIVGTDTYSGSQAAGTGMILTSDGEILTNNHVVEGATSLEVTVFSTGRTYSASVVGTDATDDVAVIQLKNANDLKTIPLGDSTSVGVGDKVVASGNAGGKGVISTVSGSVTALNRSITASDGDGSSAEKLSGLIQTDAPIVAGDSGGALADSSGDVIGMNTAASVSNGGNGLMQNAADETASEAYAIPIDDALAIAKKIEAGDASSTITIGVHGFLGVELSSGATQQQNPWGYGNGYGSGYGNYGYGDTTTTSGALIAGVVTGQAADQAGLQAGDTVTSVNGTAIDSVDTLNTVMGSTKSGQTVTIGWTDSTGTSHTASVTLGAAGAE